MATINFRALRESYRIKQLTDTSFRATVVATKIVLFVLALLVVFIFAFQGADFESSRHQSAPKILELFETP